MKFGSLPKKGPTPCLCDTLTRDALSLTHKNEVGPFFRLHMVHKFSKNDHYNRI